LFEESYAVVGDLAETIHRVLPEPDRAVGISLADAIERFVVPLRPASIEEKEKLFLAACRQWGGMERLVYLKCLTGGLRVGIQRSMVARSLERSHSVPRDQLQHRFLGGMEPTAAWFESMVAPGNSSANPSQPYPFCLAHPLEGNCRSLGDRSGFAAEWKWDGIRAQAIRRQGKIYLWSRGEELMEGRWPEIEQAAMTLPEDAVLDGEIVLMKEGTLLPFRDLQKRIQRKNLPKKWLTDYPAVFIAFDLLERSGEDCRALPLDQRRKKLQSLLDPLPFQSKQTIRLAEWLEASSWESLEDLRKSSRQRQAEGLMLKRLDQPYAMGRARDVWWKWKIDPLSIDAVLIYAQRGHGRRANLYTDYTFALWEDGQLVPFAKAYSGLSDAEIREVDRMVRNSTREAFGPVRSVEPTMVMEIAFEGLQESRRHKSGWAVRFPRILRWRRDKTPQQADKLADLARLASVIDPPCAVGDS
jgi:DNA ligase-1